jgi:hypothetical protein
MLEGDDQCRVLVGGLFSQPVLEAPDCRHEDSNNADRWRETESNS